MLPSDAQVVSVDDHIIEHPNVWRDRLPSRSRERGCSACFYPSVVFPSSLQGSQCNAAGLLRQGLALRCAPAGCAWDWRVGGPLTPRQVVLVVGVARARVGI